ncbi:ABC-three component system protein [Cellulosilyticum sp. I15G10I2]|uniref:ABC-three component system protein n=1 Tax=Cellulosilyticum sp. I15G10I2 TaxID=1892843 RepID=UPI00085C5C10|nr:ABC-three component system protein [Cellulosilyticum sp. I15G10I2]
MPDKYFATQIFKYNLLKATGNEFQSIFYRLMENLYNDFVPVRTQGAIGDRKCDGYLQGRGIFYQVFAPLDISATATLKSAIDKLQEDFETLYLHVQNGHWETIKDYYYIIGDKTLGIYPDLEDKRQALAKKYPGIKFYIKGEAYLHSLFSSLGDISKMTQVLDCYIPTPNFDTINFDIIKNIVTHLIKSSLPIIGCEDRYIAPDFEEKIVFNNLNSYIGNHLRHANYFCDNLRDYFNSTNDGAEEILKVKLNNLYKESIGKFDDSSEQFFYILNNLFEINDELDNFIKNTYYSNIFIIMSFYFEACDIFEEPIKIVDAC